MDLNVLVNGFPKSGTHAVVKALQLLGLPTLRDHIPHGRPLPSDISAHVFVKRDPRNIVISWLRWQKQPVTQGTFISRFRKFQDKSLCKEMLPFSRWLKEPDQIIVRFEDLIASDAEMRRLAALLRVPY